MLKLSSPDEVESVFYEAFMHCDQQVMAALWASGEVICIHPGSSAIVGSEAVVRSWMHILDNAQPPTIEYQVIRRTQDRDLAVHLVSEAISTGIMDPVLVLATNVYQRFEQGWLMIEHHASLVRSQSPQQVSLQ